MSQKMEIRTIEDMTKLDARQQKTFLKDLEAWLQVVRFSDELNDAMKGVGITHRMDRTVMNWVDDDRPGEMSGIDLSIQFDREGEE